MKCDQQLKFLAKVGFCGRKYQSLAAFHQVASRVKFPAFSKCKDSFELIGIRRSQTACPIVLINLRGCPRDLAALRFFLWCARQPHYFHDKPAFRYMVRVVANLTREHGSIKRIIQALETVGCPTRPQTFLLLMRIYLCGEMHDMLFEAYGEMIKYGYIPNTYVENIRMDASFKIGQVDKALRILEKIDAPNFLSFNIAICNLCRLNDLNNVKKVVRRMLMKGYYMNPETYMVMLICICQFARFEEALQLLGMMTILGIPVSLNAWSILIDCSCKSGHIEVAAFLLQKMVEVGCIPNVVTCTSLIKGFFESCMPEKAVEILKFLESKGCFPDLVLCNVLIDGFSKIGRYKESLEVFSSMKERKITPDVYTYSSLVSAICLSGQYVLLPLLTSGLAIQPDLVVCNCLLSYFCKSGYPRGTIEFYDDMIERGFIPDKYSLAEVLTALCKAGYPHVAVEFYNDMIERGFIPDKYNLTAVLTALCRLGRIRDAVNSYRGIILTHPDDVDIHIHTIMIKELMQSGFLNEGMRLFRNAVAEKYPLDVMAYSFAIDGLIRGGQMGDAYGLFCEMKKINVVLNEHSYNLILSGFCKSRDVNMVIDVLKEMLDRHVEISPRTYELMKSLLPDSLFVHKLGHSTWMPDIHNTEAHGNDSTSNDSQDIPDLGISSSDDLLDACVSVG